MRESTGATNWELLVDCCKAILSAESPEEVKSIKENLPVYLRESGWDEENITMFMKNVEGMTLMYQLEGIVVDEDGEFVKRESNVQETAEVGAPAPSPMTNLNIGGLAGNIFNLAAGAVVICLALKNTVFNNKKDEVIEPWEIFEDENREDPWER